MDPIYERLDRFEQRITRACHFGSDSPDPPPAPTPVNQEALVRAQALANRVNVISPTGEAVFSGPDKSTLTITPSDAQQQILGQQQGTQIALGEIAEGLISSVPTTALSFDGLTGIPGIEDFSADRTAVEEAVFNRAIGLLDPQFSRATEDLEQSLANRGIPLGSELRENELGDLTRLRNEALENAAFQAVQAGSAEQARLFGQALTARNQEIGERQTLQNAPLQQIAALLGQQRFQPPTTFAPGGVDVVGPASLAAQQGQNAFNAEFAARQAAAQAQQQQLAGLFQLGGTLGAAAILA